MTTPSEGYTVKEIVNRIEGRLDGIAAQLSTTAVVHARLDARVTDLEKGRDRRWQLLGTWITAASGLAVGIVSLFFPH